MIEVEYLSKVEMIRKKIVQGQAQQALDELEELYKIKPVRLRWIVAKAEAMIALDYPIQEVYDFLNDKSLDLYEYDGQQELLDVYEKLAEINGDIVEQEKIKVKKAIMQYIHSGEESRIIKDYNDMLDNTAEAFLEDMDNCELLKKMADIYYISHDSVMYYICMLLYHMKMDKNDIRSTVDKMLNFGYLDLVLMQGKCRKSIVVMTSNERTKLEVLINLLSVFGQEIVIIEEPITCEIERDVTIEELTQVSMDNIEKIGESIKIIRPIATYMMNNAMSVNTDCILKEIFNTSGDVFNIFCTQEMMTCLEETTLLKKNLQILGGSSSINIQGQIVFGWYGNYLKYISMLYDIDAEEKINSDAECDFSIVVPARNSAKALKYTLMTCLKQDYDGHYEIVLSDNSTANNNEVYELFLELNDERIKYYRTPYDLPLTKSFEYAFLMAKGKFIFSIGSDDAILPWGLSVLEYVLKDLPQHQVLQWERGFYAWPGFQKSQEHQFIIPKNYIKNDISIMNIGLKDYIAMLANDPNSMYGLPMLYINSGYRREYLKELIARTGRLWDGASQDVYMGLVNVLVAKEIPLIKYPITIAGMTNLSIGANERTIREGSEEREYKNEVKQMNNIAGFSRASIEKYMPMLEIDTNLLYTSLYRCIARGLVTKEEIEKIFKVDSMFTRSFEKLRRDDIKFDYRLHLAKQAASLYGREFETWFNENLYSMETVPQTYKEVISDVPLYATGFNKDGGLVLNASHFNVTNIYEASVLFATIMGY